MKVRLLLGLFAFYPLCLSANPSIQSGLAYVKPETRVMQAEEIENPGYVAVDQGRQLFNQTPAQGQSCSQCHGENGNKFDKARIASYPVWARNQVTRLQDQLHYCQTEQAKQSALPANAADLIALETFVRHLAQGQVMNVNVNAELKAVQQQGESLFRTRYGLIDMSCAHCHEMYPGQMLRGQKISQAASNGFPAYRLNIGEMTNLSQRIQQCLSLMRAEPFTVDSGEMKALEVYLSARSNGLMIETPAIRY